MASSPFSFGPLPPIRRSVIDPMTGNVTQGPQTPPSALDLGGAYLDLLAGRAKDAVTAPQRALSGELQVWNPETGHTTDAASEAASGMAGLAMTGGLGGVVADGVTLGAGPVRRLSYDSPLRGARRVSQAQVEKEIADRTAQAAAMAADPSRAPRAPLYKQEADALTALLPKFGQGQFPRGRPFQANQLLDGGDNFAVRLQPHGDAARTYRIHERGPDGSLSEPIGSAAMSRRPDGRWETSMLEVSPEHQGKGAARSLYEAIERHTGVEQTPSGTLLPDGYAFWKARNPDKVQFHQSTGESYLSPRRLTEMLDEPGLQPSDRAAIQSLLDLVPAEGKTPEALAKQFVIPGALATGASAAALGLPDEAQAAMPAFSLGPLPRKGF